MKTIQDKIFGTMTYDYSWRKKDALFFSDRVYKINITAKAYGDDEIISLKQQESYIHYKAFLDHHKQDIQDRLMQYCKEYYLDFNSNQSLDQFLIPTEILFEQDGSWGILFESNYDEENGLALFVRDNKIIVDSQDMLL